MTAKRNYGIDLLRLILMFMICVLHTIGQGGVLRASDPGSLSGNVYWFIEASCICAADAFAIISGFMAQDKPYKYSKIIDMWFQLFFYIFILSLGFFAVGLYPDASPAAWIKNAFPVTFKASWYFNAFFATYFFAPIIHKYVASVSERDAKKMLLVLACLFSGLETVFGAFYTIGGYAAIWLIFLYTVGAITRKFNLFAKKSNLFLILTIPICIVIAWLPQLILHNAILITYVSPPIALAALVLVILFSRINISGKIIGKLSPYAFGIYLFQANPAIWANLRDAVAPLLSPVLPLGILEILLIAAIIFTAGLITEILRSLVAKLIRLHKLSEWAGNLIQRFGGFLLRKMQ